jgi:hypothetical protein
MAWSIQAMTGELVAMDDRATTIFVDGSGFMQGWRYSLYTSWSGS